MDKEELEYLLWFFSNADFGPADEDVRQLMEQEYTEETGKPVPENLQIN